MAFSVAPGCVSLHTLRIVSDDGGTGQNGSIMGATSERSLCAQS